MKRILPALAVLLLAPLAALPAADASRAAKPNIIIILADDVGLGNLGCTGGPFKTPHLDALAKGGLRFSTCYAMPQCAPSRCVLLTGRYPFRTGLLGNHGHEALDSKREVMIPAVMKQAGYVTASVGKGHGDPLGPGAWGCDEYFLFPGDNGTAGGYTKTATVNGRVIVGHKLKLLEGGSHVPLICNWSGVTPAGRVLDDLVDFSDFFATFADLGGAKLPDGVKVDGHSFAPQLRGGKGAPRDWIFVQLGAKWYVRDQGFKLNESGELFDMSGAPFAEKPAANDGEKAKLQAILNQLNPAADAAASRPGIPQGKKPSETPR